MKKTLISIILMMTMMTGCAGGADAQAEAPPASPGNNAVGAADATPTAVAAPGSQAPERAYIAPEMKGEITVSVQDDNEFVNLAAERFMDKYPDVTVTVNTFRTLGTVQVEGGAVTGAAPSEEQSTENYLSLLNTKIMTGKAEDIIMTDPIPLRKYIEMSAFEDLSFFLKHSPEINAESHYMHVFDLMKDKNGALYEIPMTWSVSQIYSFNQDLVDDSGLYLDESVKSMSYRDALAHAKNLVDNTNRVNTFLEIGDGAHTAFGLVNGELGDFINFENKEVNINNERFIEILNYAKGLLEQGYYDTDRTIDFYNMEYYFALDNDMGFQAAYYALLPDADRYHSMPMSDKEGNVTFVAYPKFGINGASPNKELAWEFLKFMLMEEMQTAPSLYGMGVNKKGYDTYLERTYKMYSEGNNTNAVSQQDYEALLRGWTAQINSYVRMDHEVTETFIWPEIRKFVEGAQTAEETAQILQSKLDKYFNE